MLRPYKMVEIEGWRMGEIIVLVGEFRDADCRDGMHSVSLLNIEYRSTIFEVRNYM